MKAIKDQKHLNDEQIALYVDALCADKTDDLSPEILSHIEDCKSCHRQAIDLYSILDDVDYTNVGAHPTFDKKAAKVFSMPRLLMRLAAAVALLVVAFYFFNKGTDLDGPGDIVKEETPAENTDIAKEPKNKEEKILQKRDINISEKEEIIVKDAPVKVAAPKQETPQPKSIIPADNQNVRELYAANFQPSEEWEEMRNEAVRSTSFEVLQPKSATVFKLNTKITFQWEGANESRYIIVMNNKGAEVHKAKVITNTFDFDLKLNPGLYYWKLDSDDDLLHVGSFTVE